MHKHGWIAAVIAVVLILIGAVLFTAALSSSDWRLSNLSTVEYTTHTYTMEESFEDILAVTSTADIILVPSEDESCKVVCMEAVKEPHSVTVKNGKLEILYSDTRKWYEHVTAFSMGNPQITIYLPEERFASINLQSATGSLQVPEGFSAKTLSLSSQTGDVECNASAHSLLLETSTGCIWAGNFAIEGHAEVYATTGLIHLDDIACQELTCSSSTGRITLAHVISQKKMDVRSDTGEIILDGCDAPDLLIRSSTGNIIGSLLTDKVFDAESDTGSVTVPASLSGGSCKIRTDTGDITIRVP